MPFVEFFLAGDGDEENINHYAAVRMRVVGTGNLDMHLASLDRINTVDLFPFTLSETNAREPTRLVNFVTQRALLKVSTDVIDEYFDIDKVIIFARELYKEFPGLD